MNRSKVTFPGDKKLSPEQIDKLRTLGLRAKCRFSGYHRVPTDVVKAGGLKVGMVIAFSRTGEIEYYEKDR